MSKNIYKSSNRPICLLLIIVLINSSCMTSQRIWSRGGKEIPVEPGDEITLVLADAERHKIRVVSITDETINGKTSSYLISEIRSLEKEELDILRTAFVVPVAIYLTLLAFGMIMLTFGTAG
jgi:hypothetical protein